MFFFLLITVYCNRKPFGKNHETRDGNFTYFSLFFFIVFFREYKNDSINSSCCIVGTGVDGRKEGFFYLAYSCVLYVVSAYCYTAKHTIRE